MKVKLICLSLTLLLLTGSVMSQSQLRGGINLANVSVDADGRIDDANSLTSFQAGILTDIPLGGGIIFLQPGLLFTGKGSKVQKGTAGSNGYYKQTFNPKYIEVPVTFLAKVPIGTGNRFFAGVGPYLGVGIAGDTKTEGQTLGIAYSDENDIRFSDDDPTTLNQEEGTGFNVVKRFDYGLNGTVGIEGKSMTLGVNYGLGMAKLQSGTNNGADNNNKHRVLSFTLGFKL